MSENHQMLVYANGVEIGKIGSEEYVQLKKDVRKTASIYLMQAANMVYSMMVLVGRLMIITPISVFWSTVAVMVVDPASASQIVAAMHSRFSQGKPLFSMDDIQTVLMMLFYFSTIYGVLIIAVHGRLPGFVNMFDDEISRRIKMRLKQPVYGDLSLVEDRDGAGGGE